MELRISKITLDNFKGLTHKEIELNGKSSKICGANGTGKTSTMDAVLFVFASVNSKLVNNPPVTPIGASEVVTSVEIECTLDNKPIKVAKSLKYKEKVDPDTGKTTATTVSNYSINDVEYNQTNFIKNLAERGIDLEHFLYLCHPDAFTADVSAKGREKIREILFSMIDDVSDIDIVNELNTAELKALLEQGYTIQEIDSMSKASLRKINERYGKSNERLEGRIQGIIQSKSQIDVDDTKKKKTEYEAELELVCKDEITLKSADSVIEGKIAELVGKQDEIERNSRIELENRNALLSEKLRKAEHACEEASFKHQQSIWESQRTFSEWENCRDSLNNYRELYKKVQDEVFDEESTVCPSCGRSFPADEVETMKKSFEESKKKRLDEYKSKGEELSKQYDALTKEHEDARTAEEKANKVWHKADDKVQKLTEEYQMSPRTPNMNDNEEYKKIQSEIESLRSQLGKTDALKLQELSNKESYLLQMIKQMDAELTLFERNKELDQQIADLRAEKRQAEIDRAKNEKVIDQVKTFEQKKNDLLSDCINKKFSMVNWKLWEYQKNGEIKQICEPYIDSKPMSSAANGSLITLAKISICADLQRFYDFKAPIWCEDYSLFSSNTAKRINIDSQLIGLAVTEDKDLKVEGV